MRLSSVYLFSALFLCGVTPVAFATSEEGDPDAKPSVQSELDPSIAAGDIQTKENSIRYPAVQPRSVREPATITPTQQGGVLSGRIVYTSPGHGWQWSSNLNRWATDRGNNNQIVEDFGNQDQFNYWCYYLFNAGATVVPFRPIGNQTNERIVDNTAATFTGTWSTNTGSSIYYGGASDSVKYHFCNSSLTETAVATYRPNIPQAGYYPIYTWVYNSSNRASDQLYRVIHSGGISEVKINHIRVGRGWVYLGTYYLEAGTGSYVEISNKSASSNRSIIADAIRFGNGMGDVPEPLSTSSVSGYPREDEACMYWIQRGIGRGGDSVVYSNNVNTPPRMAAFMNNSADGPITDRLYIGIHSNAGGGRGARGLIHGTVAYRTPNQSALADIMGREVNLDMVAISPQLPETWSWGAHTFTGAFGEQRGDLMNQEMDGIILETAFHDHASDAAIMRDPDGRKFIARAMLHGAIKYFNQFGGGSAIFPPNPPVNVRARGTGNGTVNISWSAPPSDPSGSGSPSSYVVYRSTNGYGFGNPVAVPSGTQANLSGLTPGEVIYLRVASRNAAGESFPTETMAVRVPYSITNPVLIVNAFDRVDASSNVRENRIAVNNHDRVKPWKTNNFDYVVQHAKALKAADRYFDSSSNEALTAGVLSGYQALVWIGGEESTVDETFSNAEQTLVQNFLNAGKGIMVSGAEIGWDLEAQTGGQSFYNNYLMTDYVSDSANTYNVNAGTGIFSGVPAFNFAVASDIHNTSYPPANAAPYNADYPDVITGIGGSSGVLTYSTGGVAAVAGSASGRKVVSFGFPFECIASESARNNIMIATMGFLGVANTSVSDWAIY